MPELAFHARLIDLALQAGNAEVPQVHGAWKRSAAANKALQGAWHLDP
jgi:hypothetical protein